MIATRKRSLLLISLILFFAAILMMPSMVFARSGGALGGVAPDYVYSGFQLANIHDEIVLTCGTTVIDQVLYDVGMGWLIVSGASISLDPLSYNSADNDSSTNWCLSDVPYGTGDLGTPGIVNPPCP